MFLHRVGVALQVGEGIERIGARQLARVDQTHKQIADTCAVRRPIEIGVFAVQDRTFQTPLDNIVVQRRAGLAEKERERLPMREEVSDRFSEPTELGSIRCSSNCVVSQPCSWSITGPLCV